MDTSRNPTPVLAALSLTTLLSSLGTSSANVALPTLAQVFHSSFQQVQWAVLAYLVAMTTLVVGVGLALQPNSCIVAAEEEYLTARFGDAFRAYCKAVPRWIPRLDGLRRTLSAMRFHWRRVVVKEYGTPFGWVNILAAVTLYEIWDDGDWNTRPLAIDTVLVVAAVTTFCWFVAWRLKRSGALRAD